MSLNILPQKAFQPIFFSMDTTNKKSIRCAKCKKALPAGQGHKWDYADEVYAVAYVVAPSYYCDACHNHRLALLEIEGETKEALAQIREWCQYVALSMEQITYEAISRLVYQCDLAQADAARAIVQSLNDLDEHSYSAAMTAAQKAAKQAAASYYGGEL